MENHEHDQPARLTLVENRTNLLASELAGIKRDVAHVSDQIQQVVTSVHGLTDSVSKSGKTNWGTLGTWASVIAVALCTYSELRMAPINGRMDAMKEHYELRVKLAEERQRSHERLTQVLWQLSTGKNCPVTNDRP